MAAIPFVRKTVGPAALAPHLLWRHFADRFLHSRFQVGTFFARELLAARGCQPAFRIFGFRAHDLFFFRARWLRAAFMLSTRLGYLRPALFAAAFALALLFGLSLVCRLFFGARLFHGAFFLFPGIRKIRI